MPDVRQVPAERVAGLPKLPPAERFAGSLDGIPRIYRHEKCGVATEMPDEVIRSYLADPSLYNDWVWCCGCEDNIRQRDLTWIDSGERLSDYFQNLKRARREIRSPGWILGVPGIFGIIGLGIGFWQGGPWLGLGVGLALGILVLMARRLDLT